MRYFVTHAPFETDAVQDILTLVETFAVDIDDGIVGTVEILALP